MRFFLSACAMFALGLSASADTLSITVTGADGAPLPNAVILTDAEAGAKVPETFTWPNAMEQKDIQFAPYVLIAPIGSKVQFPNRDRVRHHVYSFAKGNRFELKLYGKDETRSIEFEKTGIVAVGCNIHDGMIGYIRVVDTPHAVKTDGEGKAVLTGLPSTDGELTVWHPDMNAGKDMTVAYSLDTPELTVSFDSPSPGHSRPHH